MSKLFQPALNVEVRVNPCGEPTSLRYKGKLTHVTGISRRWRIRESWWREEVAREYFQVETSPFVCMVYRDLGTGSWHLQRIYG
jgi:hypothetical protein